MSILDRLDALASGPVDRAFGEGVVITPRKAGGRNSASVNDPGRPATASRGVFALVPAQPAMFESRQTGANDLGITRVVLPAAYLDMTAAAVAALGFRLAKGDWVTLPGRTGAPTYQISDIAELDHGSVTLHLGKEPLP